ncbi:MAG: hypothetical protein ACK5QC_07240 [Bacteroidota bacterium]
MKTSIKYFTIAILILILLFSISNWQKKEVNLIKYLKITTGLVTSINPSSKTGTFCDYEFKINGFNYKGSSKIFLSATKSEKLIGKIFLIVYDSTDFRNNNILILKKHYEKFKLNYPDSLNWIEN